MIIKRSVAIETALFGNEEQRFKILMVLASRDTVVEEDVSEETLKQLREEFKIND